MKASRRYAVNLNCILNLTEEWPGEPLFNSISFWSQEKDGEKAVELGIFQIKSINSNLMFWCFILIY